MVETKTAKKSPVHANDLGKMIMARSQEGQTNSYMVWVADRAKMDLTLAG